MGPQSQFAESNPLSWQWSVLCGDFHGIPLAKNSIECNSVPVVEALVTRDAQLELSPLH